MLCTPPPLREVCVPVLFKAFDAWHPQRIRGGGGKGGLVALRGKPILLALKVFSPYSFLFVGQSVSGGCLLS